MRDWFTFEQGCLSWQDSWIELPQEAQIQVHPGPPGQIAFWLEKSVGPESPQPPPSLGLARRGNCLATFGEFSQPQGQASIKLLLSLPAGLELRPLAGLAGPQSLANAPADCPQPAPGWTALATSPSSEGQVPAPLPAAQLAAPQADLVQWAQGSLLRIVQPSRPGNPEVWHCSLTLELDLGRLLLNGRYDPQRAHFTPDACDNTLGDETVHVLQFCWSLDSSGRAQGDLTWQQQAQPPRRIRFRQLAAVVFQGLQVRQAPPSGGPALEIEDFSGVEEPLGIEGPLD